MSQKEHGNGNGNGMAALLLQPHKKPAGSVPTRPPERVDVEENSVTFKTAEGTALRGALVRVQRHAVVFELYDQATIPRLSESLADFRIVLQEEEIYFGHAVISNVVDAGTKIICETSLEALDWVDLNLIIDFEGKRGLTNEFKTFLAERQKIHTLSPEFKVAVADLQMFLQDFRLWMSRAELKAQAQGDGMREKVERNILRALLPQALPVLASVFEKFERSLPRSGGPVDLGYALYAKRMLHPLVLCAPFMRRTFEKPLGYAGDYEMVNMMVRDPLDGNSLFAKVLNAFFLETPPVVAHRNRIAALTDRLKSEVSTRSATGRPTRIFSLGCGPAIEVQRFLTEFPFSDNVDITLLDFNNETIEYTRTTLERISHKHNRDCMIRGVKKSVAQLIKDNSQFKRGHYDLVYCAGLFDYLADPICKQLMEVFYELTAPGGLVISTNVHVNNPSRGWMEYMVDWFLEYRDAAQMKALIPDLAPLDQTRIFIEPSGVNVFTEIIKT
jgi:extracellular factor (EF) 3-hydroxypalmitic acid methyl ester biosynthesis protein